MHGMTSSIQTEFHAYAWNDGEQPVEVLLDPQDEGIYGRDDDRLRHSLYRVLETKEFGKFSRIYPGNVHVEAGELTLLFRAFTDQYRGRIIVSGMDEADLDKTYQAYRIACQRKVFTPAELYALKPAYTHNFTHHLFSVHLQQEVDTFDLDTDGIEAAKRIEIREIVNHDFDGRRVWILETVWFDGKPVMVINASGRDADEYHERWITDGDLFAEMIKWIRTFMPTDVPGDFVEASRPIPEMTEFYGSTIHEFYDTEKQELRKR